MRKFKKKIRKFLHRNRKKIRVVVWIGILAAYYFTTPKYDALFIIVAFKFITDGRFI